jgi:hypothetical protein
MAVARQQNGKHIYAAINKHAKMNKCWKWCFLRSPCQGYKQGLRLKINKLQVSTCSCWLAVSTKEEESPLLEAAA